MVLLAGLMPVEQVEPGQSGFAAHSFGGAAA